MVRDKILLLFSEFQEKVLEVFAHDRDDYKWASVGKLPISNVCSDGVMKYIKHRSASKNSIKNKVLPNLGIQ